MGMAICKVCGGWVAKPGELCSACKRALKRLDGYVVSRYVVDQIRWERDVAIKQLEEHGIPFCGKAPDVVKVVRCEKCIHRAYIDFGDDIGVIGGCGLFGTPMMTCDDFCSYGERKDNDT